VNTSNALRVGLSSLADDCSIAHDWPPRRSWAGPQAPL
jgi:hypothetical protein